MFTSTMEKPWFNSWPRELKHELEYPDVPLYELLRKTAREKPGKTAVFSRACRLTYAELDMLSDRFSSAVTALGVKKGDRIAVYLPNIPQFLISYYGILKAGAVVTAVNPLHKEREVERQLNDSEAERIVTLDSLYPVVANVWKTTRLRQAVLTNSESFFPKRELSDINESSKTLYSFQQLIEQSGQASPNVRIDPKADLAILQYTGGTTGTPKAAMLTHANLVANTIAFATWIRTTVAEETFLTVLPLFHIYGMTTSMNVPLNLAAKIVLLPRFDTTEVLTAIEQHKVTVFCGVPTMYAALLANPEVNKFNLTSIRVCISGASPLPPQVQHEFVNITGGLLVEGYGLTEASPVTHCNPIDKTTRTVRVGSIGLPLPSTDACIFDLETGTKPMETGEIGELAIKGPQVMKGYWKRPQETALVVRNGWLFTGDIGKMNEDGYFYITDRKKDLIKYKDYSVYPRELEDILYEHPAVRLCAVVGKPDKVTGEIPKAFVVLKDGTVATEEEMLMFVKEKVAAYKRIHEVEFKEALPTTSAGKVVRRILREEEAMKALQGVQQEMVR